MDSTELQSDSLEAKGRDELITIATALGGKPASRARKAEIVAVSYTHLTLPTIYSV